MYRKQREALPPTCPCCEYNLTGLVSIRCPECGWVVDWDLAYSNEEQRRPGTPAYGARGRDCLWAVLAALGLMLFRPIAFARRFRYDEPWWAALMIASASCVLAVGPFLATGQIGTSDFRWGVTYASGMLACILTNSAVLATLCQDCSKTLIWPQRFRLLLEVSLYATCFVATWPYFGPPLTDGWRANFLFPVCTLDSFPGPNCDLQLLGRTAFFFWWASILLIFVCVRTRGTWAKILCVPTIYGASSFAYWIGYLTYVRFPFPSWCR